MVLVAVRLDDILNRGSTPIELVHYLSPQQWNVITEEVHIAFTEANFWSCCCEITICVIFLFPFIFCCHPCNTALLLKPRVDSKLRQLNATMFAGRPVLKELSGNIIFNTDFITMETVYVDRTNTGDYSKNGEFAQVAIVAFNTGGNVQQATNDEYVAIANPVNHSGNSNGIPEKKQTMVVTVPPNAGPGSVLTVSAPNGSVLSVGAVAIVPLIAPQLTVLIAFLLSIGGCSSELWPRKRHCRSVLAHPSLFSSHSRIIE